LTNTPIRTAGGRLTPPPFAQGFNADDQALDIRAWAQMLVDRGNRLVERAERERMAFSDTERPAQERSNAGRGESRRGRGKEAGSGTKPR
jgi:hypothetical protein